MRKVMILPVLLALLVHLAIPGLAAQNAAHLSDAEGQPGQTVQLTVSLSGELTADTVGISYSYDQKILEACPEECVWLRKGTLQDFSMVNHDGVWTISKAEDLTGDLCVLTFRILPNAVFSRTEVSCKVTVKEGSKEIGSFEATGTVTKQCEHSYGDWKENGSLGHTRICKLCTRPQTQPHVWDQGTVEQNPQMPGMSIKTSTCTICGGTMTEEVPSDLQEVIPTLPVATAPESRPQEMEPEAPKPSGTLKPDSPAKPATPHKDKENQSNQDNREDIPPTEEPHQSYQPKDYNEETRETVGESHVHVDSEGNYYIHEGSHEEAHGQESVPIAVPIAGDSPETEQQEHTHTAAGGDTFLGAVTAIATTGLIIVGLSCLYKKKKR